MDAKEHEAEYEAAIDALIHQLDSNPQADLGFLLAKFPAHKQEILRLVEAAMLELEQTSNAQLPPPPTSQPPSPQPPLPQPIMDSGTKFLDPSERAAEPQKLSSEVVLPLQLGPFTLVERIGKGGMGEVYLAIQKEPIRREVAVKIVTPESIGRDVLTRFENERQSLARMNHPNIAVVLDDGSTEDCRPFFVMELVRGVGITDYCKAHRLGIRQRLGLLLQVCAGIQHAHQKGIIHRDIEPSNVLVTEIDGKPIPKVIDFGLAKIQSGSQANEFHSSHTQLGQILGTLQYMSPEQASLQTDDVDTRADVFALGVLLFELLTGTTPLENQLGSELPIDERLRRVRQQEPPRPSDRVRCTSRRQNSSDAAHSTAGGMRSSGSQFRGDLDAI